jgi:regulatory protein
VRAGKPESGIGSPKTSRGPRKPRRPDSGEEARLRGLKLLTIRSRGRNELIRSLEEKGFSAAAARQAASGLERDGWLDDAAAARAFVRARMGRYGRARIERELSARGFLPESIAGALPEAGGEEEEKALSRLFARIRRATAGLDREKRRRRIWNALTRRGFPAESISAKMKGPSGGNQDREDIG